MPIKLNVGSEFDEGEARKVKEEAQAYYKRLEAKFKLKAEFDAAAARATDAEVKRYYETKSAKIKIETSLDRDSLGRAMGDIERDVTQSLSQMGKKSGQAFMDEFATKLGTALPGGLAGKAGLGVVGALVPLMGDLAGVVASAAQTLWLLPAAAGAAGAALGTLKIATSGFDQALKDIRDPKKFAADLASLSPQAQQAALSIQSLIPAFDKLKFATQDAFFAGIGTQLQQLSTTLMPQIQQMTTGIAGAFNTAFKGIANQLMTPETQGALQTFMSNVVAAFKELAPAAAPFTKALADIMSVGSGFLPELARAATVAANAFSQFITHAKESGDLKKWIGEGLDTLRQLGDAAKSAAEAFMKLAPMGREHLPAMVATFKELVRLLPGAIKLANDLVGPFMLTAKAVDGIGRAVNAVFPQWAQAMLSVLNPAKMLYDILEKTAELWDKIFGTHLATGLTGMDDIKRQIDDAKKEMDRYGLGPSGAGSTSENRTSRPPPDSGFDFPLPGATRIATSVAGSGAFNVATTNPAKEGPRWGPAGGLFADPTWVKGYHPKFGSNPAGGGSGSTPPPFIDPSQYQVGSTFTGGTSPGGPAGPLSPGYNAFGQPTGKYGANVVDPQAVYAADSAQLRAKNNLEQDKLHLAILEKDNTATQEQLLRARNQVAEDERAYYEAQFKYNDALQGKWKDASTRLNSNMNSIFAPMAADFGISGGLPGVAKWLTTFLGNMAFADAIRGGAFGDPAALLAQQSATSSATGPAGLPAALLASNAFSGPAASAMGPAGLQPGGISRPGGGGYAGDAALLAGVPSGSYAWGGGDLAKGLTDCSGAVTDLVNILDTGSTTPGHDASTGDEAQWLTKRGFLPTNQPMPGTFQVGLNAEHTQATLPGGTQFNWGNDTDAANRGVAPNSGGAWMPGFTQHFYRPVGPGGATSAVGPDSTPTGGPSASSTAPPLGSGSGGVIPVYVTNIGALAGGAAAPPAPTPEAPGAKSSGGSGGGPWGPIGGPQDPGLTNPSAPRGGQGFPLPLEPFNPFGPLQPNIGPGPLQGTPGTAPGSIGPFGVPPRVAAAAPPMAGPLPVQGRAPSAGPGGGGGFGWGGALPEAPGPPPIQGRAPEAGPSGGGGGGGGGGGVIGQMASMLPGGQLVAQLAQRTVKFGGELAAIGVGGLMETFLPNGSALGDPSKSWLGRIAGGVSGARPAKDPTAGKTAPPAKPVDPNTTQHGTGKGQPPGPTNGVYIENMNNNNGQDGQTVANDIARQSYTAGMGW